MVELTDRQRLVLARELAADTYVRGHYDDTPYGAFCDGWDAAIGYMGKKMSEGIGHLDDNDHEVAHG